MNRDEKVAKVRELHGTLEKATFTVVTDYQGLKVPDIEKLRCELRKNDAQFRIVKNSLLRLAARETELEALNSSFVGTTAIAVSFDDPVGAAKALAEFSKEFDAMQIRSAMLDGKVLSEADVLALSKLPGKDQLRAQLLAVLNQVPTGLVRVLNGVPSKLVYALQAIKEQKEN